MLSLKDLYYLARTGLTCADLRAEVAACDALRDEIHNRRLDAEICALVNAHHVAVLANGELPF